MRRVHRHFTRPKWANYSHFTPHWAWRVLHNLPLDERKRENFITSRTDRMPYAAMRRANYCRCGQKLPLRLMYTWEGSTFTRQLNNTIGRRTAIPYHTQPNFAPRIVPQWWSYYSNHDEGIPLIVIGGRWKGSHFYIKYIQKHPPPCRSTTVDAVYPSSESR